MRFQKGNNVGQRFQPGVSGNPGGRPKKLIADHVFRKLLERDEKLAKEVAAAMIRHAMRGPRGLTELLDRVEGKVVQERGIKGVLAILPDVLAKARERKKNARP
jgi:hypothetical protein